MQFKDWDRRKFIPAKPVAAGFGWDQGGVLEMKRHCSIRWFWWLWWLCAWWWWWWWWRWAWWWGNIGDKSSVSQGQKCQCVCSRFKRADVKRLGAKWSNSTTDALQCTQRTAAKPSLFRPGEKVLPSCSVSVTPWPSWGLARRHLRVIW